MQPCPCTRLQLWRQQQQLRQTLRFSRGTPSHVPAARRHVTTQAPTTSTDSLKPKHQGRNVWPWNSAEHDAFGTAKANNSILQAMKGASTTASDGPEGKAPYTLARYNTKSKRPKYSKYASHSFDGAEPSQTSAHSVAPRKGSQTVNLPPWRHILTMEQRAQLRPPQWLTRTERQLTATEAAAWLEKTPKLNKRAKYMFQGWKMSMCETWNLLEDRRLPDEGSNSPVLQQILEPAKQEADGEAEGASPTVQSIKAAWDALEWSTRKRRAEWPHLMQAALRACPDHAHLVFLATFDVKIVPSYMAETTIDFLLHMRESERAVQPARPFDVLSEQDLLAVLRHVLENSPHGYLRVRQSSFYLLIRILGSSLDDLVSLYHELVKYEHPLHKYTRLQIAGKLANSRDPKHKTLAISVLETTLAETDLDINAPQSAALCTAILTSSESGLAKTGAAENGSEPSTSAATPAELFDVLLQRGFEPNLITYTTIIRGLCLKQELDPAIQVLQLILNETKTEPDAYVYSILMNGAKMGCNYPIIQEVARSAAARVIRHPFLWNDFLQAIYLTALNEARQDPEARRPRVVPAFPLMVQAYARVFELAPLRKLFPNINLDLVAAADRGRAPYDSGTTDWSRRNQMGGQQNIVSGKNWEFSEQLAPTVRSLPQLSSAELVEPTESTLATMVLGYIQSLSNPYDVISFYTHFRHLLQTGDPMAVRLVQNGGSKVHDIVVMALVQFDGMLRAALDVVSDMLRDAAASLEAGNMRAPTSASASAGPAGPAGPSSADMDAAGNGFHPPPSVYTWSILVNGFMLHRQHNQAESVINMMRERGIEPNLVTWNSLLAGYARSQKASNVMKTFERLEASGQEPDDFTYRGLSYLSNQTSVVRQLESRQAQAAKAAEEASSQAAFDAAFSADDAAFKASQPTDGAASSPPVSHSGHEHGSISSPSHRVDKDLGRLGHSGARTKRRELTYDLDELNRLEGEVAEIAKMMDEEQENGKKGSE